MTLLLPLFILIGAQHPLAAQRAPEKGPATSLAVMSREFQALAERVDPAVVQIVTRGFAPAEEESGSSNGGRLGSSYLRAQRGSGSGVIVDPDGYILTNAHVVGTARRVRVLVPQPSEERLKATSVLKPSGKLIDAEVLGIDRETDIAVLRIQAGSPLPVLPFGDSEDLRQGHIVFAFGSPFGLENSVTMGIISSVARQVRPDDPMIYLQTDAAINPGNSGGPLVDTEGRIVGINTFIVSQSGGNHGIGFAAPANIVKSVYEQIRTHGRVRRGQIGVIAQTVSPALAKALDLSQDWGVILSDVAASSAAETAGLAPGDLVLTLDGKVMENARQFGVNIYAKAGQTITLELQRGRQKLTRKVAVLERPRDPDRILALATAANTITRLGIVGMELDARVFPLLPPLRRLSGVLVAGLLGDSAAAGGDPLAAGDVIYAVNGQPVSTPELLRQVLAEREHGETVALQVERFGQLQYLLVEVD